VDILALMEGLRWAAMGSAFTLGLRHGFDWDHVAAISDITSSVDDNRRSMLLSTLYILGHALVVTALGVAAIAAGSRIPGWLDAVMGRVVGVTLIALGIYVLVALIRHGRDARLRSRWMLALAAVRQLARWIRRRGHREPVVIAHDHEHPGGGHHQAPVADVPVAPVADSTSPVLVGTDTHRHRHVHLGSMPEDPFAQYGRGSAFGVGMLHGIGAETPTQIVLFTTAAGAGSAWTGVAFLFAFVAGLMLSNTGVAIASRLGVLNASRNFAAYATITVVVAVLSLYLGVVFLMDAGEGLPGILT